MIDDVEAAWSKYSFAKVLTPLTAGPPTDGQKNRTEKLAYVCFSRAEENLRIVFFSKNAKAAGAELVSSDLFLENEVPLMI